MDGYIKIHQPCYNCGKYALYLDMEVDTDYPTYLNFTCGYCHKKFAVDYEIPTKDSM